ncbi:MAG: zinc ABC transporter substrate-binding protein [Bacteroidota bacterium]|nr:zinc ABC transporter substrate-binding protein [Bacteroidota bacterium]
MVKIKYKKLAIAIKRTFTLLLIASAYFLLTNCSANGTEDKKPGIPVIVTTTGMIADAVKNIVKDSAQVISLMGPGVDPHLYKATQGDLGRLTNADFIFYNGLHLEGKMGDVLEKLSRQKKVVAVAEYIEKDRLIKNATFQGSYDPHVWFDVTLWKEVVNKINQTLMAADTSRSEYYAANASAYLNRLDSLHLAVSQEISSIPESQRVLITAHDAFSYFGRAYNIEVKGLQGISTVAEYGLRDVSDLVNFIIEHKIKSVFVETSVSERSIKAVVAGVNEKGHKINIGGSLYSDAMGPERTDEGTYIGMVGANVATIVKGLK